MIDKRNRLDADVFSYQANKDGKVFIFWLGKPIMTLKDQKARKFLNNVAGLGHKEAQLLMAKLTGNFKHGNER